MAIKKITDEIKAQICAEYQDQNTLSADIRKRYGLSGEQLKTIIDEAGIPPRRPGTWGSKRQTKGFCPNCRRELAKKEARFCWHCGADVRSAKQILVERLEELTGYYDHIPAPVRDKYISTLNDAIAELKK